MKAKTLIIILAVVLIVAAGCQWFAPVGKSYTYTPIWTLQNFSAPWRNSTSNYITLPATTDYTGTSYTITGNVQNTNLIYKTAKLRNSAGTWTDVTLTGTASPYTNWLKSSATINIVGNLGTYADGSNVNFAVYTCNINTAAKDWDCAWRLQFTTLNELPLTCGGTAPTPANAVVGPSTYTTGYTPISWTYDSTATTSTSCKWKCNTGYYQSESACVAVKTEGQLCTINAQ